MQNMQWLSLTLSGFTSIAIWAINFSTFLWLSSFFSYQTHWISYLPLFLFFFFDSLQYSIQFSPTFLTCQEIYLCSSLGMLSYCHFDCTCHPIPYFLSPYCSCSSAVVVCTSLTAVTVMWLHHSYCQSVTFHMYFTFPHM